MAEQQGGGQGKGHFVWRCVLDARQMMVGEKQVAQSARSVDSSFGKIGDSSKRLEKTKNVLPQLNQELQKSNASVGESRNVWGVLNQQHGATAESVQKASDAIQQSGNQTEQAATKASAFKRALGEINISAELVGKTLGKLILLLPLWMAFRAILSTISKTINAIKTEFIEYSKEMGRVATVTLTTGTSIKQFAMMQELAISSMHTMTASAKDAATAMYHLGTAGLDATSVQEGFKHVLNLSVATMTDVNTTGRLMAGAYRLFGNQLDETMSTADKFNSLANIMSVTFASNQVELSELASAFGMAAAEANSIEFQVHDLVAALGTLNSGLLKGSRAGTNLAAGMARLSMRHQILEEVTGRAFDPTKPAQFNEVMEALYDKFKEGTLSLEDNAELINIFSMRGIKAIKGLLLQWDNYQDNIEKTRNVQEDFTEGMRRTYERTLPSQLQRLSNHFKGVFLDIGKDAERVLLPSMEKMNDRIEEMSEEGRLEEIKNTFYKVAGEWSKIQLMRFLPFNMIKDLGKMGEEIETEDFAQEQESALLSSKMALEIERKRMVQADKNTKITAKNRKDLDEYTNRLKALGASELQIAQARLNFMEHQLGWSKDIVSYKEAEIEKELILLNLRRQNAEIIRGAVSGSLRDAMEERNLYDFAKTFQDRLRESIINAFLDAAAENIANELMSATNFDFLLGDALGAMQFDRAIVDGSVQGGNILKKSIVDGAVEASNIMRAQDTRLAPHQAIRPDEKLSFDKLDTGDIDKPLQEAGNRFKNALGGVSNLIKNIAPFATLGLALGGTAFGRQTTTQAFATSPTTGVTSAATTRSTTKAKVTNIQIAPVFHLDGASIQDQKVIQESARLMAQLMKDEVVRLLESEGYATGNI